MKPHPRSFTLRACQRRGRRRYPAPLPPFPVHASCENPIASDENTKKPAPMIENKQQRRNLIATFSDFSVVAERRAKGAAYSIRLPFRCFRPLFPLASSSTIHNNEITAVVEPWNDSSTRGTLPTDTCCALSRDLFYVAYEHPFISLSECPKGESQ
jgi:hypothetical protein